MDVVFYLGACTQGKGYIHDSRDVVSTRQKGFCRFWLIVHRGLQVAPKYYLFLKSIYVIENKKRFLEKIFFFDFSFDFEE